MTDTTALTAIIDASKERPRTTRMAGDMASEVSAPMQDDTVPRDRPVPPSHAKIARAWASLPKGELERIFPEHRAPSIGWGEPMCFRCGWLPPVRNIASFLEHRNQELAWDLAWNGVGCWLEKAHLHDYARGGSNDPLNFVLLCPFCHEEQPESDTREVGIAYVAKPTADPLAVSMLGWATDGMYAGRKKPEGAKQALRWMLRAKAVVADSAIAAIRAHGDGAS